MLSIEAKQAICEYNQAACAYADALNLAAREGRQPDRAAYDAMVIAAEKAEQIAGMDLVFALDLYRATLN